VVVKPKALAWKNLPTPPSMAQHLPFSFDFPLGWTVALAPIEFLNSFTIKFFLLSGENKI
jgi:hypothetical protein